MDPQPQGYQGTYYRYTKRAIDIFLSTIGLVLGCIPMLIIWVAVKLDSKGPGFYRQERIGKDGKVFIMYKFRTMYVGRELEGQGVYSNAHDERVTKVGRFLRKISIDEIPQAINILKGDMSLIGPRPPLTFHPWTYDKYTEEQKRMFLIRPGMTGWAQVCGRRHVEWNKRIELNNYYVDNVSFALDWDIFKKTFKLGTDDNENIFETVNTDED